MFDYFNKRDERYKRTGRHKNLRKANMCFPNRTG